MRFEHALADIRNGFRARRYGWITTKAYISIQEPDQYSKMTVPYLYITYLPGSKKYPDGLRCPWIPSQTDLLGEDWVILYKSKDYTK